MTTLLTEALNETETERAAQWAEYREILTRGDKADAARLRSLMVALERDADHVQADVQALYAADVLEADLAGLPAAVDEADKADKAAKAAAGKLAAAQAKADVAWIAHAATQGTVAALEAKAAELEALEAANFELFAVAAPPVPIVPAYMKALQAVPGHAATVKALATMGVAHAGAMAMAGARDKADRATHAADKAAQAEKDKAAAARRAKRVASGQSAYPFNPAPWQQQSVED